MNEYVRLDRKRREALHSDGAEAYLFQPVVNYRTLEFARPLSTGWCGTPQSGGPANAASVGSLSARPEKDSHHACARQGLTYRQAQMMCEYKNLKTPMPFDHGRENLEQNAVNFLGYKVE